MAFSPLASPMPSSVKRPPGTASKRRLQCVTNSLVVLTGSGERVAQRMQVVLRIRPVAVTGPARWSPNLCLHATSQSTIAIVPPEGSQGCAPTHCRHHPQQTESNASGSATLAPPTYPPWCLQVQERRQGSDLQLLAGLRSGDITGAVLQTHHGAAGRAAAVCYGNRGRLPLRSQRSAFRERYALPSGSDTAPDGALCPSPDRGRSRSW